MSLTKVTYSMISGACTNVLDFGAVGDYDRNTGTGTDSTAAILAAIAHAQNQPAGTGRGIVYFPEGNYKVTSTLSIGSCSLEGAGAYASWLHYTGSSQLIYCAGGDNHIQNLGLYGSNSTVSSVGIEYNRTLRHRLVGCNLFSFNRAINMYGAGGTYGISVQNNYFAANVYHVYAEAIGSGQFPTTCWFTENEFITGGSSAAPAIYLQDCAGFTFERNVLQGNGALYTIHINYFSADGNSYTNHRIINNWFEENGQGQVGSADILVQGNYGPILRNLIANNQHYTSNGNNPTYGVICENTDTITIRGNTWNLGNPWTYIHKVGVGNKNWDCYNPQVVAKKEMDLYNVAVGKNFFIGGQTVNPGVNDVIVFNITDTILDSSGLWDKTNNVYTCAANGAYQVTLQAPIVASLLGQSISLNVYVNAAPVALPITKTILINQVNPAAPTPNTLVQEFTLIGYVELVVGDEVTFTCENFGTGAETLTLTALTQASIILLK